jgi:titin
VALGSTYYVTATTTSGLAVSFSSLTNSVCTIAGNGITTVVTVVAEGVCSIEASQSGNATTLPAPEIIQSAQLVVAPTTVVAGLALPSSIDVNWADASSVETHFRLQRRIRNGDGSWGSWLLVALPAANASTYNDAGVTAGLAYGYRVQACMGSICSAWTMSPVLLLASPPAAPGTLVATMASTTRIDLSWPAAGSTVSRFEITRRTQTAGVWSGWSFVAMPASGATTYNDLNAIPNTRHEYQIRACNVAGCSVWTRSLVVATETVPAAPSGVTAIPQSASQVDVSWNDVANEDRFEVQRRVYPGGLAGPVTRLAANATAYSDLSASTATTYRYRVRACNIAGCSAWKSTLEVTTP